MDISISHYVSRHNGRTTRNVHTVRVDIFGGTANNVTVNNIGDGSGIPSVIVNGRDILRDHMNQQAQEGRRRRPEEILHGVRGPGRVEQRRDVPRTTALNDRVLRERHPIPIPGWHANLRPPRAPRREQEPVDRHLNRPQAPGTRPRARQPIPTPAGDGNPVPPRGERDPRSPIPVVSLARGPGLRQPNPQAPAPRPILRRTATQAPPVTLPTRTREREALTAHNTFQNLPQASGNNDNECPICMDDIRTPGIYASCKACRYQIHGKCIQRWMLDAERRGCPVW